MRFRDHSMYDNWTVTAIGDNVSSIIDKLIRLAAKNTEYFASDIVYTIEHLNAKVANFDPYTAYLGFRDGGVSEFSDPCYISPCTTGDVVQWWKLTYDPKNGCDSVTTLIRQDLTRN